MASAQVMGAQTAARGTGSTRAPDGGRRLVPLTKMQTQTARTSMVPLSVVPDKIVAIPDQHYRPRSPSCEAAPNH